VQFPILEIFVIFVRRQDGVKSRRGQGLFHKNTG
jgi:hypothetical protein